MEDEIKEILQKIKNVANRETASRNALMEMQDKDYQLLLDYITNLQEENERLIQGKTLLSNKLIDMTRAKEDYKSRCEKAIEYNIGIIKDTKGFYRPTEDIIYSGDTLIDIAEQNIHILQGSDKE